MKLGDRGLLSLVDAEDDEALMEQLVTPCSVAANWAMRGYVTTLVVLAPVSVLHAASGAAVAGGLRSPAAVEMVFNIANEVADADAEIAASVFESHFRVREAQREARSLAGRS